LSFHTKAIERGQFAADGHLEDRPSTAVVSALLRCAVKISIAAQHERRPGVRPIGAVVLGAKAIDVAQLAGGGHFEYCPDAVRSAIARGSIVVAVGGLNHGSVVWVLAVRAVEGREIRKGLRLGAHRQAEGDGCNGERRAKVKRVEIKRTGAKRALHRIHNSFLLTGFQPASLSTLFTRRNTAASNTAAQST
jgi:hypothetical protein